MKFSIKELRKSSLYVTPNLPDIQTKRYKFNLLNLLALLVFYTSVIVGITVFILMITPSEKLIFLFENSKLAQQQEKIIELEKKVLYLNNELNHISSVSNNLNRAIRLGLVDSVDSNSAIYDSLQSESEKNLGIDGNILKAFEMFIDFIFQKGSEIFFVNPITGYINKEFNPSTGHMGIDYAVAEGTPIIAAADGYVILSDYIADDGNVIMIKHEMEYMTVYKHCESILKRKNEFVKQGEVIAFSGNSGINTYGPHLHFEIWKKGMPIDPREFIVDVNN